jgi:23S rRNA pseudouridine1911/1915/1917 synthase
VVTDTLYRVALGAGLSLNMAAPRRSRSVLAEDAVVFLDAQVIVVRKPSGISTIPFGDDEQEHTLDEQIRTYLTRRTKDKSGVAALGVVHRLDKETSGLIVFTRTWLAKKSLTAQFRAHTVHRRYMAIAHGDVRKATYRTHLLENRGDGLRGSFEQSRFARGKRPEEAKYAVTHIEPVEKLNGATLVRCILETGRTHQIRIHLSEAGNPIVGERVYSRHFTGPEIPAPRLMLHAAELGFVHPATNLDVRFEEPLPKDFEETLARLRRS